MPRWLQTVLCLFALAAIVLALRAAGVIEPSKSGGRPGWTRTGPDLGVGR